VRGGGTSTCEESGPRILLVVTGEGAATGAPEGSNQPSHTERTPSSPRSAPHTLPLSAVPRRSGLEFASRQKRIGVAAAAAAASVARREGAGATWRVVEVYMSSQ